MRVPLMRCGLVRTAVGRLAVAAKARVIGSECRNGGSVNSKHGSAAALKQRPAAGFTWTGARLAAVPAGRGMPPARAKA
jgi:hypothetical protein